MENATKALLIAAAVLVAILIIGLGLAVYNQAAEGAQGANLDKYEIQQFNEEFTKYDSTNASGSEVNALLKTVFNHNNTQEDATTCVEVTGAASIAKDNNITKMPSKVSIGARYSIVSEIDSNSKLVYKITITQKTTTP